MESPFKYDPEDIESLLLHKQFHELYPEEKEFVLRHLGSPEEYESLRKTLFEVRDASRNDEWIEPDARLKRDLMTEFSREKRGGFFVWLNTLFAAPSRPWYQQTGWQVSLASLALLVGLVVLWPRPNTATLAALDNREPATSAADSTVEGGARKEEEATLEKPIAFAEAMPVAPVPPAPVTISQYEQTEEEVSPNALSEEMALDEAAALVQESIAALTEDADNAWAPQTGSTAVESDLAAKSMEEVKVTSASARGAVSPSKLSMNVAETKTLIDVLFTAK